MRNTFSLIALAILTLSFAGSATAVRAPAPWKATNYVIFSIKGDCDQEDCIAAINHALRDQKKTIASMDLTPFAYHQTLEYKTLKVVFWDLKTAPFADIMHNIAALGYNVVSYAIHDTHGNHDVIIPH